MPVSGKNCAELSNKHLKVDFVIIYEILMASSKLLYQIHKPLNEIFSPSLNIPSRGKKGDLYQLTSVHARPIFVFNEKQHLKTARLVASSYIYRVGRNHATKRLEIVQRFVE